MQNMYPTDAVLATLASAGEVEAFAGLLERYRPSLYATAVGLLHDREEAQDAVQDTCVTALLRLSSLRDPAAVGGWLHRVVRNTCLMRLRRSGRENPTSLAQLPSVVPGPDDVLDEHGMRDLIGAALQSLNPEDRATVLLRYFTRCESYEAIAHRCTGGHCAQSTEPGPITALRVLAEDTHDFPTLPGGPRTNSARRVGRVLRQRPQRTGTSHLQRHLHPRR